MNIEEVRDAIRGSLGLEGDVEIDSEVLLEALGVKRIDFVDIMFRLGAYDAWDFSGGGISERGRKILVEVGKFSNDPSYGYRFSLMSVSSWEEILESLTPMDIYYIANYKRRERSGECAGVNG
ncbi:MAG: hypothetical protein V1889_02645 [archaeon]